MRAVLAPPDIQPISEKKKTTRRKKLFAPDNENCVDLDPCDVCILMKLLYFMKGSIFLF